MDAIEAVKADYLDVLPITNDPSSAAIMVLAVQLRRLEIMATTMYTELKAADENR